jgi:putative ABC transport system permease protein
MRSSLEFGTHRSAQLGALAAVVAVALGVVILAASKSISMSFVGVFTVLLGCTLATPLTAIGLTSLLARTLGRGFGMAGRMAVRSVGANLSRTGIAMAALMMALAVTVSIGLMISSFRNTVERWLQASLPADLYITSAAAGDHDAVPPSSIDDAWLAEIVDLPGIERVNALRRVRVASSAGEILVVALDIDARSHGAFSLKQAVGDGVWDDYHAGRAVLASEPLAFRAGLDAGREISFGTPADPVTLPIAGVFYDYSTDRGYLLMSLDLYRRLWDDDGLTAASAFVADGLDLETAAERVRQALPFDAGLIVRSDAVLRSESLRVFDRTFRITGVLRALAIVVAMIGILGSLMALQLERTRELGLLRAFGLTRRQLWRLVTTQTGIMGLISGILALPVGIAMAAMMIYVVNRRSFGWTMPMEVDPAILLQTVALAVVAAVLAGVIPSRRMASVSPSEALREE